MNDIKLLVVDVDGVLSDGTKIYTRNGVFGKVFMEHDFTAAKQFKGRGINVVFMTSDILNIDLLQIKSKHIIAIHVNRDEKLDELKLLIEQYNVNEKNTAYIGDDIEDMPALQYLCDNGGWALVPKNASPCLLKKYDIIDQNGGKGVLEQLYEEMFNE